MRCRTDARAAAADAGGFSTLRAFATAKLPPTVRHDAVVFLVIAQIATVFGFGGIAGSAVGIANVLFLVFIVLAAASLVFSLLKRG